MEPDYLHHLRAESVRFLDAVRHTSPTDRVPTCPEWSADDLLWHLGGEVQWFWASVVAADLRDVQQVIDLEEIERPGDRDGLLAVFTEESARLHRALSETDPAEPRWMWVADPAQHHIGYIGRRQAHEALIHRLDAELTARMPTAPIDPAFAADGVDEAVRLMHGNHPAWGSFRPSGTTVRLHATDTGDSWVVTLGRFAGTTSDGEKVDAPSWSALPVDEGQGVAATITATAADLDLWLWNRPAPDLPTRDGDPVALETVDAIVGEGVD